jgi:hypothetical protein
MALQPFVGTWPLLSFLIQYTISRPRWMKINPLPGLYLYVEQHKHRINAYRHPCELDSNPRPQYSSGRRLFVPYHMQPLWSANISSISIQNNLAEVCQAILSCSIGREANINIGIKEMGFGKLQWKISFDHRTKNTSKLVLLWNWRYRAGQCFQSYLNDRKQEELKSPNSNYNTYWNWGCVKHRFLQVPIFGFLLFSYILRLPSFGAVIYNMSQLWHQFVLVQNYSTTWHVLA